jgi:hypothetical protein
MMQGTGRTTCFVSPYIVTKMSTVRAYSNPEISQKLFGGSESRGYSETSFPCVKSLTQLSDHLSAAFSPRSKLFEALI